MPRSPGLSPSATDLVIVSDGKPSNARPVVQAPMIINWFCPHIEWFVMSLGRKGAILAGGGMVDCDEAIRGRRAVAGQALSSAGSRWSETGYGQCSGRRPAGEIMSAESRSSSVILD